MAKPKSSGPSTARRRAKRGAANFANQPGRQPGHATITRGPSQSDTPTFREKPVRSGMSKYALATLIQKEAKNIGELADTMECDYQVKYAMAIIASNIASIEVSVKATGSDDPRAKLLAEQMDKLWHVHLADQLEFVGKGRVAFEKVWDYNEAANVHFVRKLEPLPYSQTEMILEPDTGKFEGISLKYGKQGATASNGGRGDILEIPQPNSWWLALDPTPIQPHGKSRHNGAPHRVYQERQQAIRLRKLFLQKMVLMGGVAHVPDQITLENGQSLDTFAEMARAHDDRLAGGMMILSNKKDADGDYEFCIDEQPSTLDPSVIDNHIDGLDQEQLQAYNIPPKTVIEGDAVGSFAMVSIQRLILDALIEHILGQMEKSFQAYLIDKVVQANFAADVNVSIKISHDPLLDQSNQIMAQLVEAILTSPQLPAILTSGVVDVMKLLKDSRIPLLPGAEAAIQKLFQQALDAAKIAAGEVPGQPGAASKPPTVATATSAHVPPSSTNGHPPTAKPPTPTVAKPPQPAVAKFVNATLANRFQEHATSRLPSGQFVQPATNPLHKRMRTRYTAHADDVRGTKAAAASVLRDLKNHAITHAVDFSISDPAVDGAVVFHARGPSGSVHARVGNSPVAKGHYARLPPGFVDIPVSGRPIGETHAKVGQVKGLMEQIKKLPIGSGR